jgi:hypothetical protein
MLYLNAQMLPGWPDWANFSPIGPLFSLGSFSKIKEVNQYFGLLIYVGYILGDFISNSLVTLNVAHYLIRQFFQE